MKEQLRAALPCPADCGGEVPVVLESRLPEAPQVVQVPVRCRACGAHVPREFGWPDGVRLLAWTEAVHQHTAESQQFLAALAAAESY